MAVEQIGVDIAEKNNGTNALVKAVKGLANAFADAQSGADKATPANKRFGDGAKKASSDVEGFGKAVKGTTGSFTAFQGAVSSALGAMSVKKMIDYADTYTNLRNQLTLVTKTQGDTTKAMNDSFNIAQRSRTSYEETAKVYGKVTTALRAMNEDTSKAAGITETIAKAVALSGSSAEAAANGLRQFQQAMDSGVLRGEEFNSVMENTPGLARALAEGLAVPIGALRSMAENGELTAARVTAALEKAGPKVSAAFAQTVPTVSQAFQTLENAAIRYIGQADQANGFTKLLATGIIGLANNVNILVPALAVLAAAVAVVGLGFLISQVASLAVGFTTLLASVGPLLVALAPFAPVIAAAAAAIGTIIVVLRAFGITITDVVNAVGKLLGMKTDLIAKSSQAASAINDSANAAKNSAGQFNRYGEEVKGAGKEANKATDFLQNLVGAAGDTNKSFGDLAGSTAKAKVNLTELNKEAQKTGDFYNQLGEKIYDASKAKNANATASAAATRSMNALGNEIRSAASANDNLKSSTDASVSSINAQSAAASSGAASLNAYANAATAAAQGLSSMNEVKARNAAIGGQGNYTGKGYQSGNTADAFVPDYSPGGPAGMGGGTASIGGTVRTAFESVAIGNEIIADNFKSNQLAYTNEFAGGNTIAEYSKSVNMLNSLIKEIKAMSPETSDSDLANAIGRSRSDQFSSAPVKLATQIGKANEYLSKLKQQNRTSTASTTTTAATTTNPAVSVTPRPIQVIINTPDYNSFRRSEKQIQTDMLRNVQKAAS